MIGRGSLDQEAPVKGQNRGFGLNQPLKDPGLGGNGLET